MSGLASSESFLIATAFLILFMAFPPTFAEVFARLVFDWLDETANHILNVININRKILFNWFCDLFSKKRFISKSCVFLFCNIIIFFSSKIGKYQPIYCKQ